MYRLRVVVEEIKGFCDLPMKPGDWFLVDGGRLIVPSGKHVCIWALQAMMPFLTVKQRRLAEENDWIPTTSRISCPDPNGMVIYRVDLIDEEKPDETRGRPSTPAGSGKSDAVVDEGTPERLLVTEAACTGCRRCELACSFKHESKYWPEMSRVRVDKDERAGVDKPVACRQCGSAKCVQACARGALSRDPSTRAVALERSKCLKCYACAEACPFQAVRHGSEDFPLICDLCGGEPACAGACPTGALRFGRAGDPAAKPRFAQPGKEKPGRSPCGPSGDGSCGH